ncbi:DUF1481 domain-containing protein [Vibrio sp. 11986-1-5]|uniref:DUF1481 domain-containing protein n=1 Tax=Vibrio sp. 11986-1-5 TaxID=2211215 RepID=UPI000D73A28F|nr:DUF1481 domain-containing protein [Vibrio sp. 11986-1-5]PXA68974.1 DUF1481 domain-containing protein [Vibrio sp. 11986-1-5]
MKKSLSFFIAFLLLTGCASSVPHANLDQLNEYVGGQTMGDATHFYWYTEYQNRPSHGADQVLMGDYGWYQTNYRWESGSVREAVREGMQLRNAQLVPYRVHVRFNQQGEAVYQQFRVDGKVLPLNLEQRSEYLQQAQQLVEMSKQQARQGWSLYQGVWDGERLTSCSGRRFSQVLWPLTTPEHVMERLKTPHYVALLGRVSSAQLQVDSVLSVAEPDRACMTQPALIDAD